MNFIVKTFQKNSAFFSKNPIFQKPELFIKNPVFNGSEVRTGQRKKPGFFITFLKNAVFFLIFQNSPVKKKPKF